MFPFCSTLSENVSLINRLLPLRDFAFWSISSRSLKRRSFTIVGLCLGRFVSGLPNRWALSISIFGSSILIMFFRMSRTFASVVFQSSSGDSSPRSEILGFRQFGCNFGESSCLGSRFGCRVIAGLLLCLLVLVITGWTSSADGFRANSAIDDLWSLVNRRLVFNSVTSCVILVRNLLTRLFVTDVYASRHGMKVFSCIAMISMKRVSWVFNAACIWSA